MTIPEKIKYYRTALNLSQSQTAKRMNSPGITGNICRWEAGKIKPTEGHLKILRNIFLKEVADQKNGLEKKFQLEKARLEMLEANFDL